MEKYFAWFQGFIQGMSFQNFWDSFHVLEWFLAGFLLLGVAYGMKRGFLRVLVELLEFMMIIFLVMANHQWLSTEFLSKIPKLSWEIALPIAYFLVLSVVWASIIVLDQTLGKWIQAKTASGLKVAGGVILGPVYFYLIFGAIAKGLSLIPHAWMKALFITGHPTWATSVVQAPQRIYDVLMKIFGILLTS